MARIVLGVSGGIAAYKAALLLRLMTEDGHSVRVVPTEAALRFVGAPTWEALSGQPVSTTVFDDVDEVAHVRIGHEADLVVIAPATADLLARAAAGLADDLLGATLLTTKAPVVMAPAMHTEMWRHPATQANIAILRHRGVHIIEPDSGRLTGADSGPGRLPEPGAIYAKALVFLRATGSEPDGGPDPDVAATLAALAGTGSVARPAAPASPTLPDLSGTGVLISAGGTREPLDPVRFLGNRSSGRQGVALAQAAAASGATVRLVAANVEGEVLAQIRGLGIAVAEVETTAQLHGAMREGQSGADVVVMAAAVSDYRPAEVGGHKLKKHGDAGLSLSLVQNPDILVDLVAHRAPGQTVVGFAAETGDERHSVLEYGAAKLRRKGADLLVVNQVGDGHGFGTPDNTVTLLGFEDGEVAEFGRASGSKVEVSAAVLRAIADLRAR